MEVEQKRNSASLFREMTKRLGIQKHELISEEYNTTITSYSVFSLSNNGSDDCDMFSKFLTEEYERLRTKYTDSDQVLHALFPMNDDDNLLSVTITTSKKNSLLVNISFDIFQSGTDAAKEKNKCYSFKRQSKRNDKIRYITQICSIDDILFDSGNYRVKIMGSPAMIQVTLEYVLKLFTATHETETRFRINPKKQSFIILCIGSVLILSGKLLMTLPFILYAMFIAMLDISYNNSVPTGKRFTRLVSAEAKEKMENWNDKFQDLEEDAIQIILSESSKEKPITAKKAKAGIEKNEAVKRNEIIVTKAEQEEAQKRSEAEAPKQNETKEMDFTTKPVAEPIAIVQPECTNEYQQPKTDNKPECGVEDELESSTLETVDAEQKEENDQKTESDNTLVAVQTDVDVLGENLDFNCEQESEQNMSFDEAENEENQSEKVEDCVARIEEACSKLDECGRMSISIAVKWQIEDIVAASKTIKNELKNGAVVDDELYEFTCNKLQKLTSDIFAYEKLSSRFDLSDDEKATMKKIEDELYVASNAAKRMARECQKH